MNKLKYRPDIDGLRALAVLSVIICHFNSQWLPGGFIGVDLFFVISGYIITSSIYPQITSGTFSFALFYVKRIKRILPLFYLVALFSLVVSWFLFTPDDLVAFSKSLRYSSGFIANLFFQRSSGYFAPASETVPLLHIWSLSIEEQFYFIWPICLILFSRFLSKKTFISILTVTILVLIGFSQYFAINNSSAAYYLIQSRGFELLVGASLAIILSVKREKRIVFSDPIYQMSGIAGLVLIFVLLFAIDQNSLFPGYNAALVTIGASCLIFSGENRNGAVYKFFSNYYLTFIGTLSYSLYLWHWPIIAFYRYYNNTFGIKGAFICGAMALLFSFLSWKLFEVPLRYMKLKKRWVFILYLIIPIVTSVFIAKTIEKNDGYGERFSSETLSLYEISRSDFDNIKETRPIIEGFAPFEPYLIGDEKLANEQAIQTLFWGDSHAGHFSSFIDRLGKKYNFSSLYGGLGGCPPVLGVDLLKGGKLENECAKGNDKLFDTIIKSDVSIVFLSARWSMYSETRRAPGETGSRVYLGDRSNLEESVENSRRAFLKGLDSTIQKLVLNDKTPVIIRQVPEYPFNPSNCLIKKASYSWLSDLECDINKADVVKRLYFSNKAISSLQNKYPSLIVIDPNLVLCTDNFCKSELSQTPLYRDNNHLNAKGSEVIFEKYLKIDASKALKERLLKL